MKKTKLAILKEKLMAITEAGVSIKVDSAIPGQSIPPCVKTINGEYAHNWIANNCVGDLIGLTRNKITRKIESVVVNSETIDQVEYHNGRGTNGNRVGDLVFEKIMGRPRATSEAIGRSIGLVPEMMSTTGKTSLEALAITKKLFEAKGPLDPATRQKFDESLQDLFSQGEITAFDLI